MLKIKQVQTKYGSFLNLENDNFIRECLEKLGVGKFLQLKFVSLIKRR
jgi:hypothetical protein